MYRLLIASTMINHGEELADVGQGYLTFQTPLWSSEVFWHTSAHARRYEHLFYHFPRSV